MHPEGLHGLDEVNVAIAVELSVVRGLIRIMAILVIQYCMTLSLPGSAAKVSYRSSSYRLCGNEKTTASLYLFK